MLIKKSNYLKLENKLVFYKLANFYLKIKRSIFYS